MIVIRQKYYNQNISTLVKKFTKAAKINKLDGVVCGQKKLNILEKLLVKIL